MKEGEVCVSSWFDNVIHHGRGMGGRVVRG